MKKINIFLILTLLIINFVTVVSFAQEAKNDVNYDVNIDWIHGYIEAVGMAVPPENAATEAQGIVLAREGAIVSARARLLEYIKGVHIDERTTVVNLMANSKMNQKVSGFIKGTYIVNNSGKWDGQIYTIKMRKDISDFYQVIYKNNQDEFALAKPTKETPYTGLIIDARNVDLTPQIMFKIVDESGNVIYSSAQAYYLPAIDKGLAGFAPSINDALNNPRVGDNPLIIKAKGASGENNTVVMVSNEDGQKIEHLLAETEVFREAKIIVVIDK